MSNIAIIIEREYLERVKKKSFIFTTILMPVLMLALMALPALIMTYVEGSVTQVLVVDNNGAFADRLTDTDDVKFIPLSGVTTDSALNRSDADAILVIPANIISSRRASLRLVSNGPSSLATESAITGQVNKIIENERLKQYNIADLDRILEDVNASVSITTVRNDRDDDEQVMSSGLSYGIGVGMSFILYMFLLIYGQMVMTSIIEEKGNRVLEVVVSSVKPAQLMLGKIIGVGLVAVVQVAIWGVLLCLMSAFLLPALMPETMAREVAMASAGTLDAATASFDPEMLQTIATIGSVAYIAKLFGYMMLFLIGGFLFYASIFAAIGSAVDNIQDASQLQSFAILPILVALIFAFTVANDPNSTIAVWLSIIPFTSPMVMLSRIPFDIASWQIWLSVGLLYLSFVLMAWIAAKIYRVGIFMYGKKPTIADLIRWARYK